MKVIPDSQGMRVGFWMLTLAAWSLSLAAFALALIVAVARWDVGAGVPFAVGSVALTMLGFVSIWLAVLERRKRDARARGR